MDSYDSFELYIEVIGFVHNKLKALKVDHVKSIYVV